jgi:hypothetical protein
MTTKLKLYNKALRHLSTIRLNSLTENRKERYELDAIYDDTLQQCLEEGLWKFASRTVMLDADTAVQPDFGYDYAFSRPTDYVRMMGFTSDEYLKTEITDWVDENNVWYAATTPIYLRYVSNGATYGLDLAKYPEYYAEWVGIKLALNSALPITRERSDRNDLLTLDTRWLSKSQKLGAVNEPVKTRPAGRLVNARRGNATITHRNGRQTWS